MFCVKFFHLLSVFSTLIQLILFWNLISFSNRRLEMMAAVILWVQLTNRSFALFGAGFFRLCFFPRTYREFLQIMAMTWVIATRKSWIRAICGRGALCIGIVHDKRCSFWHVSVGATILMKRIAVGESGGRHSHKGTAYEISPRDCIFVAKWTGHWVDSKRYWLQLSTSSLRSRKRIRSWSKYAVSFELQNSTMRVNIFDHKFQ